MHKQPLKSHLLELKARVIKVLLAFVIVFCVCYYFSDHIYQLLLSPLASIIPDHKRIIYTGLAEAFFSYLKLSAFSSFVIILPFVIVQIYLFIAPGLYPEEKKTAALILFFSPILFWFGGLFVFFYVMPKAWVFFLSFESKDSLVPIVLEAKISEYLGLVMQLIIAFGLAFQLPVVVLILDIIGLIKAKDLQNKRRLAVVINFIIAGVLTPPDVLSQFALALPLLLLYEVSIIICKFIESRGANVRHKMD